MPDDGGGERAVDRLVQDFQTLRRNAIERIADRLSDETARSVSEDHGSALRAILMRPLFEIDPSALQFQLDRLDSAQLEILERCLSEAKEVVRQSCYDYEIEEAVSRVESALPAALSPLS